MYNKLMLYLIIIVVAFIAYQLFINSAVKKENADKLESALEYYQRAKDIYLKEIELYRKGLEEYKDDKDLYKEYLKDEEEGLQELEKFTDVLYKIMQKEEPFSKIELHDYLNDYYQYNHGFVWWRQAIRDFGSEASQRASWARDGMEVAKHKLLAAIVPYSNLLG